MWQCDDVRLPYRVTLWLTYFTPGGQGVAFCVRVYILFSFFRLFAFCLFGCYFVNVGEEASQRGGTHQGGRN